MFLINIKIKSISILKKKDGKIDFHGEERRKK